MSKPPKKPFQNAPQDKNSIFSPKSINIEFAGQKLQKKELEIELMTPEAILADLKAKALPVFGTEKERKERLKKFYGIHARQSETPPIPHTNDLDEKMHQDNSEGKLPKKASIIDKIEEMKQKREDRRKKAEEEKRIKLEREAENLAIGRTGDVDFEHMIEKFRSNLAEMKPHLSPEALKINVCVRKRPIFKKELLNGELDCVTVRNPNVLVHDCKLKVDGITKYLDNVGFEFDNSFSEQESSEDLYKFSIKPLIPLLFNKGVVTCFAYGQTGSGKTFTMRGTQEVAISDMFEYGSKYASKYIFFLETT